MRGSIRKRSKDSWTLEISLGFDPSTGKRLRRQETVRGTKRQAEAELARLIHAAESGTDLNPARLTTNEYLDRWLTHMRTRVRPATWNGYEGLVRRNVRPLIGRIPLAKVRPAHIQSILDTMISQNLAARTIIQAYRVVHQAFKQARRWQILSTNPAEAIQPPRPERPALTIPTSEELKALIVAAEQSREGNAITLLVATGLRRGELLGLRWRDVDLDGNRLHVTASLQRVKIGGKPKTVIVEPKTDRARRGVSLPAFAIEALRRQRTEQSKRRLLLGEAWNDHGLVFERGDGTPYDPDTFSSAFQRIAKKAGLTGVRLHDVRHGYATALLAAGVHPKIASEALGHSSVAFTLDTYSHVVPSMQQAAADAISQAIEGT